MATQFIGNMAVKFAGLLYGKLAEAATARAGAEEEEEDEKPKPKKRRRQKHKVPPPPPREPADLEELSLGGQRMWLVRRFRKLKPGATPDEIKAEWRRLSKIYHPDNKKTGNEKTMKIINETYAQIKEIRPLIATSLEIITPDTWSFFLGSTINSLAAFL